MPHTANPALIVTTLRDIANREREEAAAGLARASAAKAGVYGMTNEQLSAREAELAAREGE